MFENTVVTA